jgi:hypothetical protein
MVQVSKFSGKHFRKNSKVESFHRNLTDSKDTPIRTEPLKRSIFTHRSQKFDQASEHRLFKYYNLSSRQLSEMQTRSVMHRAISRELGDLAIPMPPTVNVLKPKSQSIAIKTPRCYEDYYGSDNSSEKLYDWATWRMYNRIMSSRKCRHASVAPYPLYHDGNHSVMSDNSFFPSETKSSSTDNMSESLRDGEMFQLEM